MRLFLAFALCAGACSREPVRESQKVTEPAPVPVPAPVPPVVPAPPAKPPSHRLVAMKRDQLEGWIGPLPTHGIYLAFLGLSVKGPVVARYLVDTDTRKLTAHAETKRHDVAKTLTAADVDQLWQLVEATWAAPEPDFDQVTDFRQVIVAVDGPDVMMVSVPGPLHPSPAQALTDALIHAAGW